MNVLLSALVFLTLSGQGASFSTTDPVLVSLPDTFAAPGALINVPVYLDDVTGLEIYSSEFGLSYDPDLVTATGILVDSTTLAYEPGWSFEWNTTDGEIQVALAGGYPLEGGGILVYICFAVNEGATQGMETTLQFEDFLFNEGIPQVLTSNGRIRIGLGLPYDMAIVGLPNEGDPAFVNDTLRAVLINPYTIVKNYSPPETPALSFRVFMKIIQDETGFLYYSSLCDVWNLDAGERDTVYFSPGFVAPAFPGTYTMVATIQTAFEDPLPENNVSIRHFFACRYWIEKGVEEDDNYQLTISNYQLSVHPNPAVSEVSIMYSVPEETSIILRIYDSSGRLVSTLVDEVKEPGYWTTNWDCSSIPSGIYFYRMDAGGYSEVKRFVVMR